MLFAGSRLYVEADRFDEVVTGVAEIAQSIKLGDGLEADTQMGPSFRMSSSAGSVDTSTPVEMRVPPWWPEAAGKATRAISLQPTVIADTRPDMRVVKEEIFGPVVVVAPFDMVDQIAAAANDSPYGLGAGFWTRDISKAHALAKRLRAGTVWINCYNVFDAALPFGGYKQSGWGREMGHEALEAYTEVKAICTQL